VRAFGKMHAALRRAGVTVGRHQTGRLMRELGLAGVRRDKARRTTISDAAAPPPADLVEHNFTASRPDQLWVIDITYLSTWVCFAHPARSSTSTPADRRLGARHPPAHRAGAGGAGDGDLGPRRSASTG